MVQSCAMVQDFKGPNAMVQSNGPRIQGSRIPRNQSSMGLRVKGSKVQRVKGFKGLRSRSPRVLKV